MQENPWPGIAFLSIDGGGIKGLVTTIILQKIVATPGLENFPESIDLIAGTSTGGLIAMSLAHDVDLTEIRDAYVNGGAKVFKDSWLDDFVDLGKVFGANYTIDGLLGELMRLPGDTTLGELNKNVMVVAFDLDNGATNPEERSWKPKIFHNFIGPDSDRDVSAVSVGLYPEGVRHYKYTVLGLT